MIHIIALLLVYFIWRKLYQVKDLYYTSKLSNLELEQVREVVENTIRNYPNALVGESFPEIKYKVLGDLYREGQITKEYLHQEIDKII